jgi:hypothetical protein
MARWKVRLTTILVLQALAYCPAALGQPADAPTGEKLAYEFLELTVQVTSLHGRDPDNIAAEGYGFVIGQHDDTVMIVTADHVVRDNGGRDYGDVRVVFYADRSHAQAATVLELRIPQSDGDLAVLEVKKQGFRMGPSRLAQLPLTQGARAWRIGKQKGWTPGNAPGVFIGRERTIWLSFDNLDTPRGSSGGPILVDQGLVGMVTDDQSGSGRRALVLPINTISEFVHDRGLPWGLGGTQSVIVPPQQPKTSPVAKRPVIRLPGNVGPSVPE